MNSDSSPLPRLRLGRIAPRRASGKRTRLGWLLVGLCFSATLLAAPLERELGENLRYIRSGILPGDLPAPTSQAGPVILDLRYSLAESDAGKALNAWLTVGATARTPVFVLLNAETAPALRELFQASPGRSHVITVGRAAAGVSLDLPLQISAEEERRAYDALEAKTPIESLIWENRDKTRVDEASLMQERAKPSENTEDAADDDEKADAPPQENKAPTEAPLVDRSLQRAVQLHRAMIALKKI